MSTPQAFVNNMLLNAGAPTRNTHAKHVELVFFLLQFRYYTNNHY
jgi:hypothetical protein